VIVVKATYPAPSSPLKRADDSWKRQERALLESGQVLSCQDIRGNKKRAHDIYGPLLLIQIGDLEVRDVASAGTGNAAPMSETRGAGRGNVSSATIKRFMLEALDTAEQQLLASG
jgi:hypothetical protein